jgi:MYXO-CTERM domain-containing protein
MSFRRTFTRLFVVMSFVGICSPAPAVRAADGGTKTLIDYFQPTPIVCPLTSSTWGAAGVLPRDTCNGLEDATNKQYQYWDGKIFKGPDGKYYLYAGQWPQGKGFADWPNSVIAEAVSSGTVIGTYTLSTTAPFTGDEQNVTGAVLSDGSYALLDSLGNKGTGNIYTSTSLADPWTAKGQFQISGGSTSTQTTENLTIWANADGSFEIMSRSFQEMVSTSNILGPYTIKTTVPSLQSQGYEDPVIWCSGGQYHLVANDYNARKANHYTSTDGINNWKSMGLAYDPTSDFVRYTDGTVNHWYKMERAGVVMENGHVSAFTFAVVDVDKNSDVANDTHGSKIIVVPFDGVAFDHDNPGPGSAGCPVDSGGPVDAGQAGDAGGAGGSPGAGGATATGGRTGTGGATGSGGVTATGGKVGSGGVTATGGKAGSGGSTATGGGPGEGGTTSVGGTPGTGGATATVGRTGIGGSGGVVTNGGTVAAGGSVETGGSVATGGAIGSGGVPVSGGAGNTGPTEAGGSSANGGATGSGESGGTAPDASATQANSGCSCRIAGGQTTGYPGLALLALLAVVLRRRTRGRRKRIENE